VRSTERPPFPSWNSSNTLAGKRDLRGSWTRKTPHCNNATIEEVEAVGEVAEESVGHNLQHHFQGKQGREEEVAPLEHGGQQLRLLVVLDA